MKASHCRGRSSQLASTSSRGIRRLTSSRVAFRPLSACGASAEAPGPRNQRSLTVKLHIRCQRPAHACWQQICPNKQPRHDHYGEQQRGRLQQKPCIVNEAKRAYRQRHSHRPEEAENLLMHWRVISHAAHVGMRNITTPPRLCQGGLLGYRFAAWRPRQ